MKCGLLGEHLGHSFSPAIHKNLGDYEYNLYEVEKENLSSFMEKSDFDGINVTIPYKKAVIPFLTYLSPEAEKIGSVNTIKKLPDGSLFGYNTDYHGFKTLCVHSGISFKDKKILVLGDGGAAPAIRAVLEDLGAKEIITVSRKGENNYNNLYLHADGEILVNTTPVGMYPKNNESLINLEDFPKLTGVLDIIYNPLRTKLIMDAEKKGIPCAGGLLMLVSQAKKAAEIFTGNPIDDEKTFSVYKNLERASENIILIGMPGCGKSTTGKALSDITGRPFIDSDEYFEEKTNLKIPEFFAKYKEEAFRIKESEILEEICKKSGIIIATGGGCVTQERNYNYLHQNGKILFLDREIDNLPTEGRPISQSRSLWEIAKERLPKYISWCDERIKMTSPERNAEYIKEKYGL